MKNFANALTPLAAAAFIGACMVSGLALLVTMMASVGFADGLPWAYFLRLHLPALSIALPVAGMILFGAILLANSVRNAEVARPAAVDVEKSSPVHEAEEVTLPKAA